MSEATRGMLAPALAIALSPIPIIAIVLVLGSQKARSNGPAFALGWTGGLLVVSTVVVVVLGDARDGDDGSPAAANWFMVALGAVLVVLAAKQWRGRPKPGDEATMSWMATVDAMSPRRSLILGVALSAANPKNLVLTLAASAAIADADLDLAGSAIAIGVFVVIGSASVAGAVLYFLVDADRAGKGLDRVEQFMTRHSAVIMTVILLVLGAKLILDGVTGLRG